jgi:23S rRNA G2445 N2-methylase RlmL
LSEAMLAKARKNAAAAGVENQVRFEMGDARRLPFLTIISI